MRDELIGQSISGSKEALEQVLEWRRKADLLDKLFGMMFSRGAVRFGINERGELIGCPYLGYEEMPYVSPEEAIEAEEVTP